jgi:F-BAR and double SH3 domains protein
VIFFGYSLTLVYKKYTIVLIFDLLQTMESGVFERVQEYLTLIGRMELLTCSATQTSFTRIRDQANKVST